MAERNKKPTLYDPFNPPGATKINVFVPPYQAGLQRSHQLAAAPQEAPVVAAPAPAPQAAFKSTVAPWVPEAYQVSENQVARTTIPAPGGGMPDKLELALHPPGARAESTFSLG